MSKRDFLNNLRVARNLFVHPRVYTDSRHLDPNASTQTLVRAAIWLTPSSVKGFKADDFPEIGSARQRELAEAIREFEQVARQVPPDEPANGEQFTRGTAAFAKVLTILDPYLPSHEEAAQVRAALTTIDLPPWVINWDYELGSDEDGIPAVWVTLYADEKTVPPDQFGRRVSEMIPKLRSALSAAGVRRWPFVRLSTAAEHKAR